MNKKKTISIRTDEERLQKLAYIAQREYRSMSGLLTVLIRQHITEFEEQHGKIPVKTNEENENL